MNFIAALLIGASLACLLGMGLCLRRMNVAEQNLHYFDKRGDAESLPQTSLFLELTQRAKRKKNSHARTRQLGDVLPLVAEMLRGGSSVETAFTSVASCAAEPLGQELTRVVREVSQANRSLTHTLYDLAKRTKNKDIDLLAQAISIQKEGGGNLASVLDAIALTIQKRCEMKGHLDSITSSARLSAILVGIMPPAMLALLSLASPSYMLDFWNSTVWPGILLLVAILDISGLLIIRRLYRLNFS